VKVRLRRKRERDPVRHVPSFSRIYLEQTLLPEVMVLKRRKSFLINTAVLTGASLAMRTVSLAFQVFLSEQMGAAGLGLLQLILTVSMFAATFAISGVRFASTRLISEELGRGNDAGVLRAVRSCLLYALCFGVAAALLLRSGAPLIGARLVGDARSVPALRLLSLSLPFLAMSAVFSGYFTAAGKIGRSAAVQVAEQLIRTGTAVLLLSGNAPVDAERACTLVVAGNVIGEIVSFLLLAGLYAADRRRLPQCDKKTKRHFAGRLLRIALPLAWTAYARTAISTVQNLLVPRGFRKSGASAEQALADYGLIQGMVFPVLLFPTALFGALSELVVPELTRAQVRGDAQGIERRAAEVLRLCMLLSVGAVGLLLAYSDALGETLYHSGSAGRYMRLLAALMPIMFLDTVTDGMLRGLGEQLAVMRYNILDSAVSTVLIWFLLPRYALEGYVFVLYFSELFNFTLSVRRLSRVARLRLPFLDTGMAAAAAAGAVSTAQLSLRWLRLPLCASVWSLLLHAVVSGCLYFLFLRLLGVVRKNDSVFQRFRLRLGESHRFFRGGC